MFEFVGPYQLISPLGEGGMGAVWRAVHRDGGPEVALKTLHTAQATHLRALRREIQSLARLTHPGIVRILDEGVFEGLPFYVMELLPGKTLRRWGNELHNPSLFPTAPAPSSWWTASLEQPSSEVVIAKREARTRAKAAHLTALLTILQKLCAPLSFMHGEGLVHRDLKPENILIRANGEPVLVDFGLAAQFGYGEEASRERLAIEAGISGTAYYMSPEQIQQEPLDARADLYAIGVILFELLTGVRPFEGSTAPSIMRAHLQSPAPAPSHYLDGLPDGVDALALGLLQKRREERQPGYAAELAQRLAALGGEADPTPARPRPYLYRPPLAGREAQLGSFRASLERLRLGSGGLTLLGGESGVGKTRLTQELSKEATRRGFWLLGGECEERDARPALGVFLRPLQELVDRCRERGLTESERLFGSHGAILDRYEPSICALPGQAQYVPASPLPPPLAQRRLFASLAEVLFSFTQEHPALLLLDDLQWADELSLGFLSFFLEGPLRGRLWIVGTYRTEERSEALEALLCSKGVEGLLLERLEPRSITRLVGEMLALSAPPEELCRFLQEQSQGNPFFVAEYLRVAVEEGLLRREEGRWGLSVAQGARYDALPLPRHLAALLSRRLSGLPPWAQRVLEASAVLGREAALPCLASMLACQEAELSPWLSELSRRHIMEETPTTLRFVHDKLREVSYASLDEPKRAVLHAAAAEALLPRYEAHPALAAELGHHYEKAGALQRARGLYLIAARRASEIYSHQEAERLYRRALSLVAYPDQESIEARNELGERVLAIQGRLEEAREQHQAALEEARALILRQQEASSLRFLGVLFARTGRLDIARDHYERALQIASGCGDSLLEGRCQWNLAILHYVQGRPSEAAALYQSALSLLRAAKARALEGELLGFFANLRLEQGFTQEAKSLHEEALLIHQEVGDKRAEGIGYGNLAALYQKQGEAEKARSFYTQSLALLREVGDRRAEGKFAGGLAGLLQEQGQAAEAHQLYTKTLTLLRELGDRREEGICLSNLAALEQKQGRSVEASKRQQEALLIHREVGNRRAEGICLGNLAEFSHNQGELSLARDLYTQSLTILQEIGERRAEGICLGNLAELYRELMQHEQAEDYYQRALLIHREVGNRRSEGVCLGNLAALYQAQGRLPEANQLFTQALSIHRETHNLAFELWTLLGLAEQARWERGELETAKQRCQEAAALAPRAKDPLEELRLACLEGHLAVWQGADASAHLVKAKQLLSRLDVSAQSSLRDAVEVLSLAQELSSQGARHALFRGYPLQKIRAPLLRYLQETGQLES